jgi:hypothetical protein
VFQNKKTNSTLIQKILGLRKPQTGAFICIMFAGALPGSLTGAHATSSPQIAQKTTTKVYGDCAVLAFDGSVTITENVTTGCFVEATVKPAKPARKVTLQFFDDLDNKWYVESDARTTSIGRAAMLFDWTKSNGCFYNSTFSYRIVVAKSGTNKAFTSNTFSVTFVPDFASDFWIANCV